MWNLAALAAIAVAASSLSQPSHPGMESGETGAERAKRPLQEHGYGAFDLQLRRLVETLLDESPDLAAARGRAAMLRARAGSERALPDPLVSFRYFVDGAETRVGPQEYALELSQEVPWGGTRRLAEERAERLAGSHALDALALERSAVAALKRDYFDAAFVQEALAVNGEELELLRRLEKGALARYASGDGIQQRVVKIQTDVSRAMERGAHLEARLETLEREIARRIGRAEEPLELERIVLRSLVPTDRSHGADTESLSAHPALGAIRERIAADRAWAERRGIARKPTFRFGLGYTEVGRREDRAGVASPPEGNGDDILGVTVGIKIPIQRERTDAGVLEARESEKVHVSMLAATRDHLVGRAQRASIEISSLAERIALYGDVILPQANAALASAESAYENDRLPFLDLLDAERVLFESRLARQRLLSDLWIACADLEEALARPFPACEAEEGESR